MAPLRRIADRLSYANTVATLALFVALGGASYAAVVVPANSVGPSQLRPQAVGTRALDFPLGATGVTDARSEDLVKSLCDAPAPPGVAIVVRCPVILVSGIGVPGREVQLQLPASGRIFASATVGLSSHAPPGENAKVTLQFVLDGTRTGRAVLVAITGGQRLQVPVQLLVDATRGTHTASVLASAQYAYATPGDVIVGPVSLVAAALPRS